MLQVDLMTCIINQACFVIHPNETQAIFLVILKRARDKHTMHGINFNSREKRKDMVVCTVAEIKFTSYLCSHYLMFAPISCSDLQRGVRY